MPIKKIENTEESKPQMVGEAIKELRDRNCVVYYEKSVTKNMGDYNSAKITVGVTLPIMPTPNETAVITTTLETADEIVTKELEAQLNELLDGSKK